MVGPDLFKHIFPTLTQNQCRAYGGRQRICNHRRHKRTVGIIAAVILFTFIRSRLLSGIFILITGFIAGGGIFINLFIRYDKSVLSIAPRNTNHHKSRHQSSINNSYPHTH